MEWPRRQWRPFLLSTCIFWKDHSSSQTHLYIPISFYSRDSLVLLKMDFIELLKKCWPRLKNTPNLANITVFGHKIAQESQKFGSNAQSLHDSIHIPLNLTNLHCESWSLFDCREHMTVRRNMQRGTRVNILTTNAPLSIDFSSLPNFICY